MIHLLFMNQKGLFFVIKYKKKHRNKKCTFYYNIVEHALDISRFWKQKKIFGKWHCFTGYVQCFDNLHLSLSNLFSSYTESPKEFPKNFLLYSRFSLYPCEDSFWNRGGGPGSPGWRGLSIKVSISLFCICICICVSWQISKYQI